MPREIEPWGASSGLLIADLMRLVEQEGADFESVLQKAFEWDHQRRLELAKWCLATSATLIVGTVALVGNSTPQGGVIIAAGLLAGVSLFSGTAMFWTARTVATRYVRSVALAQRMTEIRLFLRLLRTRGLL